MSSRDTRASRVSDGRTPDQHHVLDLHPEAAVEPRVEHDASRCSAPRHPRERPPPPRASAIDRTTPRHQSQVHDLASFAAGSPGAPNPAAPPLHPAPAAHPGEHAQEPPHAQAGSSSAGTRSSPRARTARARAGPAREIRALVLGDRERGERHREAQQHGRREHQQQERQADHPQRERRDEDEVPLGLEPRTEHLEDEEVGERDEPARP